jgi:hypothetical protein
MIGVSASADRDLLNSGFPIVSWLSIRISLQSIFEKWKLYVPVILVLLFVRI